MHEDNRIFCVNAILYYTSLSRFGGFGEKYGFQPYLFSSDLPNQIVFNTSEMYYKLH